VLMSARGAATCSLARSKPCAARRLTSPWRKREGPDGSGATHYQMKRKASPLREDRRERGVSRRRAQHRRPTSWRAEPSSQNEAPVHYHRVKDKPGIRGKLRSSRVATVEPVAKAV